jgi:hypothetical protein
MFVGRPGVITRRFPDLLEDMRRALGTLSRIADREKTAKEHHP